MSPIDQGGGKRRGVVDEGAAALFAGKRCPDALEGILNDIVLTLR
jgi:hypothetical protein